MTLLVDGRLAWRSRDDYTFSAFDAIIGLENESQIRRSLININLPSGVLRPEQTRESQKLQFPIMTPVFHHLGQTESLCAPI